MGVPELRAASISCSWSFGWLGWERVSTKCGTAGAGTWAIWALGAMSGAGGTGPAPTSLGRVARVGPLFISQTIVAMPAAASTTTAALAYKTRRLPRSGLEEEAFVAVGDVTILDTSPCSGGDGAVSLGLSATAWLPGTEWSSTPFSAWGFRNSGSTTMSSASWLLGGRLALINAGCGRSTTVMVSDPADGARRIARVDATGC